MTTTNVELYSACKVCVVSLFLQCVVFKCADCLGGHVMVLRGWFADYHGHWIILIIRL